MGCNPIENKDGKVVGFFCTRERREQECSVPGCHNYADYLCDFGLLRGRCDRALCVGHAKEVGEDRHYCPAHSKYEEPNDAQI